MEIGIPAEQEPNEYRVGMTPQGVHLLTQAGHRCYVEQGAGRGAGFDDTDYERAGGRIVYGTREVYQRADLVARVGAPAHAELDLLREEQTICAFWHLAARRREVVQALIQKQITAIAYETIQNENGVLPVLRPLSGIAGIPPIDVCILGGGTVGINAARAFVGLGARVFVLDKDLDRLQQIEETFGDRVVTMVAYDFNIARVVKFAHVLIGCVLVPGERAPVIVSREMVRTMRPRSVIIDVSIDQGGCVETSRLMSHADPVFVDEGVIHYCVPNMSSVVARTATHAYLNAAWPFIQQVADLGIQNAIDSNPALERGVAVHAGQITNPSLAALLVGV